SLQHARSQIAADQLQDALVSNPLGNEPHQDVMVDPVEARRGAPARKIPTNATQYVSRGEGCDPGHVSSWSAFSRGPVSKRVNSWKIDADDPPVIDRVELAVA